MKLTFFLIALLGLISVFLSSADGSPDQCPGSSESSEEDEDTEEDCTDTLLALKIAKLKESVQRFLMMNFVTILFLVLWIAVMLMKDAFIRRRMTHVMTTFLALWTPVIHKMAARMNLIILNVMMTTFLVLLLSVIHKMAARMNLIILDVVTAFLALTTPVIYKMAASMNLIISSVTIRMLGLPNFVTQFLTVLQMYRVMNRTRDLVSNVWMIGEVER